MSKQIAVVTGFMVMAELGAASLALAEQRAGENFPSKGDAFFLSVKVHTPEDVFSRSELEPCEVPFATKKVKDLEDRIEAADALNVGIIFRGNWSSRIHWTSSECREHLEKHGPAFSRMDKEEHFYMVP